MRDPLDELRDFARSGDPVIPVPPAEVRRRGDRLRRRNQVLTTVGSVAAALVAIAVPFAVADGGGRPDSLPPIATSPASPAASAAGPERIPAELDLTAGIAGQDTTYQATEDAAPSLTEMLLCGEKVWTVDAGTTARLGAAYVPEGTDTQSHRTLVLYPDDASAQQALRAIDAAVATCLTEPVNDTMTVDTLPAEVPLRGDDALAFTRRFLDTDEGAYIGQIESWQVVRTGNALLVAYTAGSGAGGDDAMARREEQRLARLLEPLLDDMQQHFG